MLNECPECGGVWLGRDDSEAGADVVWLRDDTKTQWDNAEDCNIYPRKHCPRCRKAMRIERLRGFTVNICCVCQSLWINGVQIRQIIEQRHKGREEPDSMWSLTSNLTDSERERLLDMDLISELCSKAKHCEDPWSGLGEFVG
jgi:Zn-finger nucleic acid-binding protein